MRKGNISSSRSSSSSMLSSTATLGNAEEIVFVTKNNRVVRTNPNGDVVHWGKQFPKETPVLSVLWTTFGGGRPSLCVLMSESVYIQAEDGSVFDVKLPCQCSHMWCVKKGLIFQKEMIMEEEEVEVVVVEGEEGEEREEREERERGERSPAGGGAGGGGGGGGMFLSPQSDVSNYDAFPLPIFCKLLLLFVCCCLLLLLLEM